MRRQWMGPVVYSAKLDDDLYQHNVVYEENGQWYKTKWVGPYGEDKPKYPVDELEGGVLIPEEDYTIPYQSGWTVATPELVEREDVYVKRPVLPHWSEKYREILTLKVSVWCNATVNYLHAECNIIPFESNRFFRTC
jgi:hypothetical protein